MRRPPFVPTALACAIASLAIAPAATAAVPTSAAAASCVKYAAPTGSDSADGTLEAPYRTAQKLVDSLAAGQVGCLRGGTYVQDVAIAHGGVTLTAAPDEQATLVGRLWIKDGADGVTISGLALDGKNAAGLPSPTVNGDGAQFIGDDVTNEHTEICFVIGSSWGRAQGTVIRGNRIHDCGKLPSDNRDHGIYVSEADDTQIVDNVIYANVDRGIQLYPDAQRTTVRGNVIDGNGEGIIFSGSDGLTANDNVVEGNVITNSNIRADVESWYPSGNPEGTGNVVHANCLSAGVGGAIDTSSGGFTASDNLVVADALYAAREAGDFRLAPDSPCAATLTGSAAPAGPSWEPPVGGTSSDASGTTSTSGDTSSGTTSGDTSSGTTSGTTTSSGGETTSTGDHGHKTRTRTRSARARTASHHRRMLARSLRRHRARRCRLARRHHHRRVACARRAQRRHARARRHAAARLRV